MAVILQLSHDISKNKTKESNMKLLDSLRDYFQVNYANLEKIELLKRFKIEQSEALMTDVQYNLYLNKKYGIGIWAEHLILSLIETRGIRKNNKVPVPGESKLVRDAICKEKSIQDWENEGGP